MTTMTSDYKFDLMHALGELYAKGSDLNRMISGVARGYLFDTDDVAQDVAAMLLAKQDYLRDMVTSHAYLCRTVQNMARKVCKAWAAREWDVYDHFTYSLDGIKANMGLLLSSRDNPSPGDIEHDFTYAWSHLSVAEADALEKSVSFVGADDDLDALESVPGACIRNTVELTPNERSAKSRGIKKLFYYMNNSSRARQTK